MKTVTSPVRIRSLLKSLLWRLPLTGELLGRIYVHRDHSEEMALIKGQHRSNSSHPSIIHFSLHKAATQYARDVLRRCATENGMTLIGLVEYAWYENFPYLDHLSASEMQKY